MLLRILIFMGSLQVMTISQAQPLVLADKGSTAWRILLPTYATAVETKAAAVLQDYFFRVTGAKIAAVKENNGQTDLPGIYVGNTNAWKRDIKQQFSEQDAFHILNRGRKIFMNGEGRGTLYAAYAFIEKYLGCRKWDAGPASAPKRPDLLIPTQIELEEQPAFAYREVYLPAAFDDEYLDWHRLQRFEALWGLWGHSFFKLVSPALYFRSHPEYFSLVDQRRQPMQLCLSNKAVLALTIATLRKSMQVNPAAVYWSVSPNDDIGNCECADCRKLDEADGGPQGSLIRFVNAVAKAFPEKTFTTLAYGYSAHAPIRTRPEPNVIIMLSSIDAYRTTPLATEPTAAAFRANLAGWKQKTQHVFVWDYYTQFTNYLTPFPVTPTFQPNFSFFKQQGVNGVFCQGSGDSYSDMHEMKSYVMAKLLWNPALNADSLVGDFLNGYYGKAAPFISGYLDLIGNKLSVTRTRLDIYGNPVNNHADYLSPANLDSYSGWMDKAEAAVETDALRLQRLRQLRLTHEYVYLQQTRFFGKERHGIYERTETGDFVLKPFLPGRENNFVVISERAGVKHLAESGASLQQYHDEWKTIFRTPSKINLAANAAVTLTYPFVPEYPAKRERTLVDETPGYADFSYNWLCFYGSPMEVTIDLKKTISVNSVRLHFLEDARHWIFKPASVSVQISGDGISYRDLNIEVSKPPVEDYSVNFIPFTFNINSATRFIRVRAENWPALPSWRTHKFKKPMIACDEVWVE
ncbi:MAG: DUF4838 domain-containing protein [Chitinophagaceae bacterium]|nr:DUF4838 domain-containing protein [Chitinophagaceae bacterium]